MLENFIYAKRKSLFEEALNNGEVLYEAIVFIEDTKEIWNHGTYFDGSAVDLSNIETSIQNILDTKADKTEIPTKVSELENDVPYVIDYTIPQGVSIMDASGNIMTAEEWSEDKGLTGLVVSDGEHKVVLGMDYATLPFGLDGVEIEDITTVEYVDNSSQEEVFNDFNSTSNTDAIIKALEASSDPTAEIAASYCRNYSSGIYGVGEWDLPAGGHAKLLFDNKNAINNISNTLFSVSFNGRMSTSTNSNLTTSWVYESNLGIGWANGKKTSNYNVYSIHVITSDEFPTLKEKVETLENKVADTEPYILDYNYSWYNTETTLTDWNDEFEELWEAISNKRPILVKRGNNYFMASASVSTDYGSQIGLIFEILNVGSWGNPNKKIVYNVIFTRQDDTTIVVKAVSGDNPAYKSDIPTKVSELENDVPYAVDSVKYIPQGVSIMDGSGNIITDPSLWSEDLGLTGIVVSDGEHEIVLGLFSTEEEATSTPWSEAALINTDVEGVINYKDENPTGYESTSNTDAIIAALATSSNPNETNNAAVKCRNFSSGIYGAGKWDLPALRHCGMFYWASEYYESIKNVAAYVGKYLADYNQVLLCSTEYDANNFAGAMPRFAYISEFSKSNTGYVLVPIHVITPEEKGTSLNDRVTSLEDKVEELTPYVFEYKSYNDTITKEEFFLLKNEHNKGPIIVDDNGWCPASIYSSAYAWNEYPEYTIRLCYTNRNGANVITLFYVDNGTDETATQKKETTRVPLNLKFKDLAADTWVEDTTYADYPYRCDLACSGVTTNDYAEVTYNVAEAVSGDYAPICETDTDIVKIWSKKNDSIVVPTVIITR